MENKDQQLLFKNIIEGFMQGRYLEKPELAYHLSLWDMFLYSVQTYPNLPFLLFEPDQSWSYAKTYENILVMKDVLISHGIKKGDKVILMLPNSPYYILGFWGVCALGGVVVNTNPMYAESELEMILKDSEATILITVDAAIIMPKVEKLSKKFPKVTFVLCPTEPKKGLQAKETENMISLKRFMGSKFNLLYSLIKAKIQKSLGTYFKVPLDGNDIAVLQYTGGTTGIPKAATLLHRNLLINVLQAVKEMLGFKLVFTKETILGALPFFHIFGFTTAHLLSIVMGSRLVLFHFSVLQYIESIKKYKPTIILGVPTMYALVARAPEANNVDFSSIKLAISGGGSLPEAVRNLVSEKLKITKFIEGYGLSETSPMVCVSRVPAEAGTIGQPVIFTEVSIHDPETGNELKQKEVGEIWVRGPQVMDEYYKNPSETAIVFTKDRWFKTGDLGCYIDEHTLKIVDRLKDMVVYKGFKIFPVLVEGAINKHPSVEESAVIGVKHPDFGEVPKAFLVLKKGASIELDELKIFLKDYLAHYEIPATIEIVDRLLLTAIGKIDKKALRAL